jgi:hypothetical protein
MFASFLHKRDGEQALALLKRMGLLDGLAVISDEFHENWGPGNPASWKIARSSTPSGDPIQPYVQAVRCWLLRWFCSYGYEPFTATDVVTAEGYRHTYYLGKTTLDVSLG